MSRKAYLWTLGIVYLAWWVLMAIKPLDFHDWLLENALVVLGVGLLLWTGRSFPLSRISYTCIFVFMMLHALVRYPGHVKTRKQLHQDGYPHDAYVSDRTIDSHIKRVRRKFEEADPGFDRVETVYGLGYRWKE